MNTTPFRTPFDLLRDARVRVLRYCLYAFALLTAPLAGAPASQPGEIAGRVYNVSSGQYLDRARVRLNNGTQETFTDAGGYYSFNNVAPGAATLQVVFSGLAPQTAAVEVSGGAHVVKDFNLTFAQGAGARATAAEDESVVLDPYIVQTTKFENGAAIAINEQRFAPNFKTVVAADEFGPQPEGNVGEFMKFLPGVTIDYGGGEPRLVSLEGAPPENVPVQVGGFNLASAASTSTSRRFEMEQFSINNISRIEVSFTPTPESPGSALAGTVNMVPRQAFEVSRPQVSANLSLIGRSNSLSTRALPGPFLESHIEILPSFDVSFQNPVSKTFGFTVSANYSKALTHQQYDEMDWRGTSQSENGSSYPVTPASQPYLTKWFTQDVIKFSTRESVGATLDWNPTPADTISFGIAYAKFRADFNGILLSYGINAVTTANAGIYSSHGNSANNGGTMQMQENPRTKAGETYTPTITWRHSGRGWTTELGASYSESLNHYRDISTGFWNSVTAQRGNVEVDFDNITPLRPLNVTVKDPTGKAINEHDINNYVIDHANSNENEGMDLQKGIKGSVRRDFFGAIPVSLKFGSDVTVQVRDIADTPYRKFNYNYVGPTGVQTVQATMLTAAGDPNNAALMSDTINSRRNLAYGVPSMVPPNAFTAWNSFAANPSYWVSSSPVNDYNSLVNDSKFNRETVYAGYLRSDLSFFERRLKLTSGVRVEQTDDFAQGPSIDPTRNYQRDPNGNIILANGSPVKINDDAGTAPASSQLAAARLVRRLRGQTVRKEYIDAFPSVNGSYNILDNLIARGGWYWSIGRPDFGQYSGSVSLPDLSKPFNSSNPISASNANIKPWSARTVKAGLEYYFSGVGLLAVNVWERDFHNLFASTTAPVTPQFLAAYGLDPNVYGSASVRTQYNTLPVTMRGLNFSYKQTLNFVPYIGNGLTVFANLDLTHFSGPGQDLFSNNFGGTKNAKWGFSYRVPRYNIMLAWDYRGRVRQGPVTGTGIELGTYQYQAQRLYVDLTLGYTMTKHFSLFAKVTNLRNQPVETDVYGPSTPAVARVANTEKYGAELTGGITAKF